MSDEPITVVETKMFERHAADCMTDDEREEFVDHIARHPDAGTIIRGAGGVRKVRWAVGSGGKSGGVRVIYYFMDETVPIYLLTVFAKSQKVSLSNAQKTQLKALAAELKKAARGEET